MAESYQFVFLSSLSFLYGFKLYLHFLKILSVSNHCACCILSLAQSAQLWLGIRRENVGEGRISFSIGTGMEQNTRNLDMGFNLEIPTQYMIHL